MDDDEDLTPFVPYVPEGCTPIFGVLVFGFIDEAGDICGGWHLVGQTDTAVVVGHMEVAKHRMIESAYQDADEDDD